MSCHHHRPHCVLHRSVLTKVKEVEEEVLAGGELELDSEDEEMEDGEVNKKYTRQCHPTTPDYTTLHVTY